MNILLKLVAICLIALLTIKTAMIIYPVNQINGLPCLSFRLKNLMLQRVAEIVLPITEFAILTGCCIWIYDTKLPYRNIVGYFIFAFCLCFAIRIVKGKWWEDKQKHADNLQNELDILQSKYADLENKYKEVIKE